MAEARLQTEDSRLGDEQNRCCCKKKGRDGLVDGMNWLMR